MSSIIDRLVRLERAVERLSKIEVPRGVYLRTRLTSTAWDGDAKAAGDSGVIDLSAVFGVPPGVKAVSVLMSGVDETVSVLFGVGPDASNQAVQLLTQVANVYITVAGVCPCDANGDVYFYTTGELDNVYLYITGYWF